MKKERKMYQYTQVKTKKKTLSHRFVLNAGVGEVLKCDFPLPVKGKCILTGYRAQVKLNAIDPVYFNRFWINAEGFKGSHRFGGPNGHELIPFSDENPLASADRRISVLTKTVINGLSVEFDVKANDGYDGYFTVDDSTGFSTNDSVSCDGGASTATIYGIVGNTIYVKDITGSFDNTNTLTNGSATATLTSDTTVDVGAFKPEIFVEIQIELRD